MIHVHCVVVYLNKTDNCDHILGKTSLEGTYADFETEGCNDIPLFKNYKLILTFTLPLTSKHMKITFFNKIIKGFYSDKYQQQVV